MIYGRHPLWFWEDNPKGWVAEMWAFRSLLDELPTVDVGIRQAMYYFAIRRRNSKTAMLRQLAKKHGLRVVNLRMSKCKPHDFRGIPYGD